jgi:hypothetical protein
MSRSRIIHATSASPAAGGQGQDREREKHPSGGGDVADDGEAAGWRDDDDDAGVTKGVLVAGSTEHVVAVGRVG